MNDPIFIFPVDFCTVASSPWWRCVHLYLQSKIWEKMQKCSCCIFVWTTFQSIFHDTLSCETALHYRIICNLGLPPFPPLAPDPCPKSNTQICKYLTPAANALVILAPQRWKMHFCWFPGRTLFCNVWFVFVPMGINEKQQLHKILNSYKWKWHFVLEHSMSVIHDNPITVMFTNLTNSLLKLKPSDIHMYQFWITYGFICNELLHRRFMLILNFNLKSILLNWVLVYIRAYTSVIKDK